MFTCAHLVYSLVPGLLEEEKHLLKYTFNTLNSLLNLSTTYKQSPQGICVVFCQIFRRQFPPHDLKLYCTFSEDRILNKKNTLRPGYIPTCK